MTSRILITLTFVGSLLSFEALADAPGNSQAFFGLSTGMLLPDYPDCMHDAPDSMKPKGICIDGMTQGQTPVISLNLDRLATKTQNEFTFFKQTAQVILGDNRQIEHLTFSPRSQYHDYIIKLLVANFGTAQTSQDVIGSLGGTTFDATGASIHQSYTWNNNGTQIVYRPYLSSAASGEGLLTFSTPRGKMLAKQQASEPVEDSAMTDEMKNLIGPIETVGCLDGICVGKPVTTLPADYPWEQPKDLRDLEKELAETESQDDFLRKNAQEAVTESRELTKNIYIAPDAIIREIAKIGHAPSSGTQRGVFVPFSFIKTLSQVKAACQPLVWDLHYTSKSGYPTVVSIAWGPSDLDGNQSLRIESIERTYKDADTTEKQFALKSKLEAAIGMKMTGPAAPADIMPVAYTMGDEFTLKSPRTLDYDRYAGLLMKNPDCQSQVSVN